MNEYSSYLCYQRGYSEYAYNVYAKRRRQSGSIRLALSSMRMAEREFRAYEIAQDRKTKADLGV